MDYTSVSNIWVFSEIPMSLILALFAPLFWSALRDWERWVVLRGLRPKRAGVRDKREGKGGHGQKELGLGRPVAKHRDINHIIQPCLGHLVNSLSLALFLFFHKGPQLFFFPLLSFPFLLAWMVQTISFWVSLVWTIQDESVGTGQEGRPRSVHRIWFSLHSFCPPLHVAVVYGQ